MLQNDRHAPESEAHAEQRRRLLDPVAQICEQSSVSVARGWFSPRGRPASIAALVCAADDSSWDAMLTVVRAQRLPAEHQIYNKPWSRDPHTGYDLASSGKVLYELQIHEDDDGGTGHGPRPLVVFELYEQAEAAAEALIQWWRRPAQFRTRPPVPNPRARQRRAARIAKHRRSASASPRVQFAASVVAGDVATVDQAALSVHFPRDRSGSFLRSAMVALLR